MLGEHRHDRGPSEWRPADECLVQCAAEAIDVAPRVDDALRLLRSHVGRRAKREAGLGEADVSGLLDGLLAMPKSATIASPPTNRMLSGLMSR